MSRTSASGTGTLRAVTVDITMDFHLSLSDRNSHFFFFRASIVSESKQEECCFVKAGKAMELYEWAFFFFPDFQTKVAVWMITPLYATVGQCYVKYFTMGLYCIFSSLDLLSDWILFWTKIRNKGCFAFLGHTVV